MRIMGIIKYQYKENIFEVIDSKEKAYWIGFLYADGYIHSRDNGWGIALKESDKEQLEKFIDFLGVDDRDCLAHRELTKSFNFHVTREKTHKDLINLGFTANKSYDTTLDVWNNIPKEFKKYFLLGFWDGDGSFAIGAAPRRRSLAGVISNNCNLLNEVAIFINEEIEKDFCKVKEPTPGDPYYRIRLYDNKAKIFGQWLYQDMVEFTYKLERKYNKFLEMKEIRGKANSGEDNAVSKPIYCVNSKKAYITAKEACEAEFGISNPGAINSIRAVARGERKQTRDKVFIYLTKEQWEEYKKWQV